MPGRDRPATVRDAAATAACAGCAAQPARADPDIERLFPGGAAATESADSGTGG